MTVAGNGASGLFELAVNVEARIYWLTGIWNIVKSAPPPGSEGRTKMLSAPQRIVFGVLERSHDPLDVR